MPEFLRLRCGDPDLDALPAAVERFLAQDRITLDHDGLVASGWRSPDSPCLWIRDHSDMLRAGRWFERDLDSAVRLFAALQAADGSLFDFVTDRDGRENWTRCVRVPVEADVEYRWVKALFLAWQAGGDEGWVRDLLPAADAALAYTMTHPRRWDPEHGLVKRALTIDTWDFTWTGGREPWLHFRIDENTLWGIHHCDNSGLHEAMRLLAYLHRRLGDPGRAAALDAEAEGLRERTNAALWNGRFYRHRLPLGPQRIPGVNEEAQLSLSNPMAVGRGLTTPAMARALVDEYSARGGAGPAFAPWFSIDPPFPADAFGDPTLRPGAYVNGGIMPLVGGELAHAALQCGREAYGVATLRQYAAMVAATGASWLWYFPDGTPSTVETSTSPEALPTDGWGSTAMLRALVEGLAGVEDGGRAFDPLRLSPRWAAADIHTAEVEVGYPVSGARCRYTYTHDPTTRRVTLQVEAPGPIDLHLMLPADTGPVQATTPAGPIPCTPTRVDGTPYLDTHLPRGTTLTLTLA